MTHLEILQAVRGLLDRPEAWGKGSLSWNEDGKKVPYTHPRVCKFSLDGGLMRVAYITHSQVLHTHQVLKGFLSREGNISLQVFNDAKGTTHNAVLDLLDKAIRKAGGQPPERYPEEDLK